MPRARKPSSAANVSVLYVTTGALILVWGGDWYWCLSEQPPARASIWFWCYGALLTGLALLLIGLAIGWISNSARRAEVPPR